MKTLLNILWKFTDKLELQKEILLINYNIQLKLLLSLYPSCIVVLEANALTSKLKKVYSRSGFSVFVQFIGKFPFQSSRVNIIWENSMPESGGKWSDLHKIINLLEQNLHRSSLVAFESMPKSKANKNEGEIKRWEVYMPEIKKHWIHAVLVLPTGRVKINLLIKLLPWFSLSTILAFV